MAAQLHPSKGGTVDLLSVSPLSLLLSRADASSRPAIARRLLVVHSIAPLRDALLIGAILAHLDFVDERIERLSAAIEEQLAPFQPAVDLLRSLGGIETRAAQKILAEIGVEMSVFPAAGHCVSSAGQCSGNDRSSKRRRRWGSRNPAAVVPGVYFPCRAVP